MGKSKSAAGKSGGARPGKATTKRRMTAFAKQANAGGGAPKSGGVGRSATNREQAARRRAAEDNSGAAPRPASMKPAPERKRMQSLSKSDAAAVKAAKAAKKPTKAQKELLLAAEVRKNAAKRQRGKVNERFVAKPAKAKAKQGTFGF